MAKETPRPPACDWNDVSNKIRCKDKSIFLAQNKYRSESERFISNFNKKLQDDDCREHGCFYTADVFYFLPVV